MYRIEKEEGYLLVRFLDDFDYGIVQAVIHHVTSMGDFADTNDIWLIGKHRADIRLGELETMVRDFQCHCPRDAARSKTAIVVNPGLTEAIIGLWVDGARKRVPFDMRIFHTFEEALTWLNASEAQPV